MSEIHSNTLSTIIKGGLRSIAASIPVAASIGQAWNEYETHRTGERIQELMDNLRQELEEFRKTDTLRGESIAQIAEQVPTLIEIAVEKVRREFSEEKRGLYARLLARLINRGSDLTYEEKTSWLHEFDVITPADLEILQSFPKTHGRRVAELSKSPFSAFPLAQADEKCGEYVASLSKLEARGLIGETTTGRSIDISESFGDPASWINQWGNRVLGLMPGGRRLLELLGR